MNLGAAGTLVSALATALFLILALATFRSRRTGREARELRQVKEVNIAVMDWAYRVRMLAAHQGWSLPPVPKEMTLEYLVGKAEGEGGNVELEQVARLVATLTGKAPGGGPP